MSWADARRVAQVRGRGDLADADVVLRSDLDGQGEPDAQVAARRELVARHGERLREVVGRGSAYGCHA